MDVLAQQRPGAGVSHRLFEIIGLLGFWWFPFARIVLR